MNQPKTLPEEEPVTNSMFILPCCLNTAYLLREIVENKQTQTTIAVGG